MGNKCATPTSGGGDGDNNLPTRREDYNFPHFKSSHCKTDEDVRKVAEECVAYFGGSKHIDMKGFSNLIHDLLGQTEKIHENFMQQTFKYIDKDQKNHITVDDLCRVWLQCIQPCVSPKCALIVVDVQNDFISGSLSLSSCPAGEDGAEVVPIINDIIKEISFPLVIFTQDWHPANHCSFIDNLSLYRLHSSSQIKEPQVMDEVTLEFDDGTVTKQIMWPRHCVEGGWGAELHDQLVAPPDVIKIFKGRDSKVDAYSGFEGATLPHSNGPSQSLDDILRKHDITDIAVTGLATDVCVGATARDGLRLGYRTLLIEDACRGVSVEQITLTQAEIVEQGGAWFTHHQIEDVMRGRVRPPQLLLHSLKKI